MLEYPQVIICQTQSSGLVDWIKWSVTLLLSLIVFAKGLDDARRTKRENSSRARQQYNSELRKWAGECIDLLSELNQILGQSALPNGVTITNLIWKLSSKADQGRFFFPNDQKSGGGSNSTDGAYQGLRPRVLSWLIKSFDVACTVKTLPDTDAAEVIVKLKRGFTSDMQAVLDPRKLDGTLVELQKMLEEGGFAETSEQHKTILDAREFVKRRKPKQASS